jgi:hypothetical protein
VNSTPRIVTRVGASVLLGEAARSLALALAGFPLGPRAVATQTGLAALSGVLAGGAVALARGPATAGALAVGVALATRAARLALDVAGGADVAALPLGAAALGALVDAAGVFALAALGKGPRAPIGFALYALSRLGPAPPDVAFAPDALGAVATFALLRSLATPPPPSSAAPVS